MATTVIHKKMEILQLDLITNYGLRSKLNLDSGNSPQNFIIFLPPQGSTLAQPIQLKGWLHLLLSEDAPTDVNMSSGNLPASCVLLACRAHFSH